MDRLVRTRSQHFVSSPRKTAVTTPYKLLKHPSKRRRLGLTNGDNGSRALHLTPDSEDTDGISQSSRNGASVLDSDAGEQVVNGNGRNRPRKSGGNGREDQKKHKSVKILQDVFTSGDESSPKKRKRGQENEYDGEDSVTDGDSSSSSWIEMDDHEEEPEYIGESDQQLLQDAPAHVLHRLKKAELVRLWKVAGMWSTEDEDEQGDAAMEDEDDAGLSKKELVDGLVAARRLSVSQLHLSESPRSSPKRKAALEAAFEIKRLRSASSLTNVHAASPSSGSSSALEKDADVTPKAAPKNKLKPKFRQSDANVRRRRLFTPAKEKVRKGSLDANHRSDSFEGEERRARFDTELQSPGNLNNNRRPSRSSTRSSLYTTDTSTSPPPQRPTPRRTRSRRSLQNHRRHTPARASRPRTSRTVKPESETTVDTSDDEANEPTPLVNRLRSRTRSSLAMDQYSEIEADGEEETEEEEDLENPASPKLSRRLRSSDNMAPESETSEPSMPSRRDSRVLPGRDAKLKAIEALRGGESETETEGMDMDGALYSSVEPEDVGPDGDMSVDGEDGAITRTTRSGKAFGVWQSRRKRLRQEAMDDPDMDDPEAEDNDEELEEEEDVIEDIDLTSATLSSLTKLLRDELVQMCESRGIEVGGTKPQLAKALLEWRDERDVKDDESTSSQSTARASPNPQSIIHAIASNVHKSGQTTPVLLRDHIHATDPATPPRSEESTKEGGETELTLDISELGLEDSIIKQEHLVRLERIGSGGFKDVYVGKLRGRKVAISEFREHLSEMDIRELKLLAEFRHPNIVKFRGICIPEDNAQVPCMLVSELCENGDLFDYIRNVPCPSTKRVLGLMLDIARGLEYLHTRKPAIIHRDCKSSNILINRAGQAKVGDFGLARVKHSTRSMIRSLVGTVNWQAPELWHPHPRYDYKVDVFSAAMVYWEMMSGWTGEKKYPWEGHNEHYIYDAVGAKQRRPSVAGFRKHWGAEPVNLMERMWHQDPGERPTMTDVVADLESLYSECRE